MSSSTEAQHQALRQSATLSELPEVAALKVSGSGAFDLLDRLVPADLFVRDGQMLHTLVLHREGHPIADIYLCRDDEEFLLLFEGLTVPELLVHIDAELPSELEVDFEDLTATHQLLSVNGPYAWEVLTEWLGPDIIGIPYLTFFHLDPRELGIEMADIGTPGIVFRAGKTGEFGYDLLLRRELIEPVRSQILKVGASLDLALASSETLDQAALENGFFCIRSGSLVGLTPIELQLQWRVSYRKEYVGSEALLRRRSEGPRQRLVTFTTECEIKRGDRIFWEDREIGVVRTAGFGPMLDRWVGQALIDQKLAHPGIDAFTMGAGLGGEPIRTVSAPVINNRSLYVDPRRHCYRYRHEENYPPLVIGQG